MSRKDILILSPFNEEVKPCASRVGEEDVAGIPVAGCALAAREAASRGARLHLVSCHLKAAGRIVVVLVLVCLLQ